MPQKHKKIIIFVHGVIGDMDNTWVNPINHASWPELVAGDKDFDGYDVYVYGYDTPCEGSSSNISEIANRFGQQLRDDHFFSNYEQIFFITHSMGGLVTKKMLAGLSMAQEIDSLQRVRAVIFIAVPSDGADIASLGSWFSRNPQFKNMDPEGTKAFLQTIEGDWGTVIRKRTEQRPFPRSFEAYETKDLGVFRIVPNLFISGISDLTPIAFDYDHIAIVKPDSHEHAVYKWTKARILESSQYGMESVIARENLVAGIGSTRIPKKVFVIEVLDGTSLIANAKVSVKLEGFEKAFDGRTDARGRFQFMWSPQSKPVRAHYIVKAKGFMELNDEYPLLDNPVYRVPLNRER